MKKAFFSMALAATALVGATFTSCSSDDDVNMNEQIAEINDPFIHFNVKTNGAVGTRGTATTASNYLSRINNFMVWGYFAEGATGTGVVEGARYVGASDTEGTVIDGDGAGNWSYHTASDQAYWPATTAGLNFQAITPASDTSFSITNTPDEASPWLSHMAAYVTVPAQASQKDIMFAKTNSAYTSATNGKVVDLTFYHGLAQVVFQGKTASTKIAATVSEISIVNVHETGTIGFINADASLGSSLDGDADASYSIGLVASPSVTTTTATNLTATDGALFMLPQTVTAWTTTSGSAVTTTAANTAHNAYLKIKCTVTSAGVTLIDNDYVYLPFSISWQQGKKYTYTIIFGAGAGGYNDDGTPLETMLPISYTAAVSAGSDWDAQDAVEYQV